MFQYDDTFLASLSGIAEVPSRNWRPLGWLHSVSSASRTAVAHGSLSRTACRSIEPGISEVHGTKQPRRASTALSKWNLRRESKW